MTNIELNALQELTDMGFPRELAQPMIRTGELPAPLTAEIRENAALLAKYVPLSSISRALSTQLTSFLRRDPEKNCRMASVPERYGFSAEQAARYRENPLLWDMAGDLREELDAALSKLVRSGDDRERIYREMYLCGAWQDGEEIRRICAALGALDCPPDGLDAFVRQQYVLLFSCYSGTADCLSCLAERFRAERIFDLLREDPTLVRAFSRQFNPFNDREKLLAGLKAKHPDWLKA